MSRLLVYLACLLALSACKVAVIAPPHGAVSSDDMAFMCLPGNTCEIDVSTFDLDIKLQAIAKPGYRFVHWKGGEHHICPDFTERVCRIRTDNVDANNRELQEMLATDHVFLLAPVFEPEATPADPEGIFLDSLLFD